MRDSQREDKFEKDSIALIYRMTLQQFEDRNIVLIILTFSKRKILHWFSFHGDKNVVRALIALGVDVHAKDKYHG